MWYHSYMRHKTLLFYMIAAAFLIMADIANTSSVHCRYIARGN